MFELPILGFVSVFVHDNDPVCMFVFVILQKMPLALNKRQKTVSENLNSNFTCFQSGSNVTHFGADFTVLMLVIPCFYAFQKVQ